MYFRFPEITETSSADAFEVICRVDPHSNPQNAVSDQGRSPSKVQKFM